jgi:hypothetical protein
VRTPQPEKLADNPNGQGSIYAFDPRPEKPADNPNGQKSIYAFDPQPKAADKSGKVLLLIENEIIVEAITRKLSDYSLSVMSGAEIGETDSTRIAGVIRQLQLVNPAARAAIPFAVVVMGKELVTPLGHSAGAYVANATVILQAIATGSGEMIMEAEHPIGSGGGRSQEDAVRNALREAGNNISQLFIRQIYARAR